VNRRTDRGTISIEPIFFKCAPLKLQKKLRRIQKIYSGQKSGSFSERSSDQQNDDETEEKTTGALTHYNDGSHYDSNTFFDSETKRIELVLFLNAFQGTNPLGSAKSKHKLHGL
jgi:hypothetical protein